MELPLETTAATTEQLQFPESPVRFLQRFFAANVEPRSLDLVRLNRCLPVEPLNESARLVEVVSCRSVGRKHRNCFAGKVI
jgi:hypothetical protein